MLGKEITEDVDESRRAGGIHGSLNSTYINLILKKDSSETFSDYRTISLCNLLYKLTTKIIADRLKPILGKFISDSQFGFMPNRQLLDVVDIAQECLHSLKKEKTKVFILNMDLVKACD